MPRIMNLVMGLVEKLLVSCRASFYLTGTDKMLGTTDHDFFHRKEIP